MSTFYECWACVGCIFRLLNFNKNNSLKQRFPTSIYKILFLRLKIGILNQTYSKIASKRRCESARLLFSTECVIYSQFTGVQAKPYLPPAPTFIPDFRRKLFFIGFWSNFTCIAYENNYCPINSKNMRNYCGVAISLKIINENFQFQTIES